MVMLTCDEVHEQLGRWYDGELPAHLARPVAEHVGSCTRCAAEVESWRQIDRLLTVEVAAEHLEASVLAALAAQQSAQSDRRWWLKLAAAAVISAALGGLGGLATGPDHDEGSTTRQELSSLTLLEQSFAPGSLEGIDALASDLQAGSTESR